MESSSYRNIEEMSFREIINELDATVKKLESDELELEDSLRCYERGVELLRVSKLRLDNAQQKVSSLMGELEGNTSDNIDERLS